MQCKGSFISDIILKQTFTLIVWQLQKPVTCTSLAPANSAKQEDRMKFAETVSTDKKHTG